MGDYIGDYYKGCIKGDTRSLDSSPYGYIAYACGLKGFLSQLYSGPRKNCIATCTCLASVLLNLNSLSYTIKQDEGLVFFGAAP